MKKTISYILLCAMLASVLTFLPISVSAAGAVDVWDGTVGTSFDGGSGTEDDPYLISSAETLAYLASVVNSGKGAGDTSFLETYFKLTCNIDLDDQAWIPIGNRFEGGVNGSTFFGGHFDGCGYAVYHLNSETYLGTNENPIAAAQATSGLFGALFGGSVKNLGIESGTVSCSSGYAGGLAGGMSNGELIENCYNKATVIKANDSTWTVIGGIVGAVSGGRIVDTINYGTVDCSVAVAWASGNNMFGGISGRIYGVAELEGCYNVGAVATGKCRGGGLGGRVHGTPVIQNCVSAGIVTGTNQFGALFGIVEGGTFENLTCYMKDQTVAELLPVKADSGELTVGKITVNESDVLTLPCAIGESFLKPTAYGAQKLSTVAEGTPVVDGALEPIYEMSARLIGYGTADNALSEDAWTGAIADIALLADYQNLYIGIAVADSEVVTSGDGKDCVELTLSFDGGITSFTLTVDASGELSSHDGELSLEAVTKAVRTDASGWTVELAVPVEISIYNLLSQTEVGLAVRIHDASAAGAVQSYDQSADRVCNMYTLGDIHGKSGVSVTGVGISQTTAKLYIGQGLALKAVLDPVDAYERGVVWSSSDTSVAAVSTAGYVTASKAGDVVITVTTVDGGFQASCAITVEAVKATGIALSQDTLELKLGKKKMLNCIFTPEDTENQAVLWSSSNEAVATVSEGGLVTACGGGVAVITATSVDGGFTATCSVTVTIEIDLLAVQEKTLSLTVGGSSALTVAVAPADATEQIPSLIWSSSDTSVATVDADGIVHAVGAGTATITFVSADGLYKDETGCTVTVSAAVESDSAEAPTAPSDSEKEGGCASVFGIGAGMLCMLGTASVLALRKKEEQ